MSNQFGDSDKIQLYNDLRDHISFIYKDNLTVVELEQGRLKEGGEFEFTRRPAFTGAYEDLRECLEKERDRRSGKGMVVKPEDAVMVAFYPGLRMRPFFIPADSPHLAELQRITGLCKHITPVEAVEGTGRGVG